jgi:hypothetical protein
MHVVEMPLDGGAVFGRESRKPSVMMSAVRAPVRSRMVLIAMVEPWRKSPAAA